MNISKHQQDDLTAIIKVELQPADYQQRVNDVIKKYAKTASIPGFRPGHVPVGMVKKMYGTSVLLEELNKMVSENLGKYIFDNKIEIIGSPLPKQGETELVLEDGRNFEFLYEIGLAPTFKVELPAAKTPYFMVKVDEKMIEDDVTDIRRRYGKFSNPEAADETCILYGEFTELDSDGNIKEGGVKTTTTLAIDRMSAINDRQKFVGLKKEDTIDYNPMAAIGNETEVAAMLKIDKAATALRSDYRFTVMTVSKIEKAELNQELFDKLHEAGTVTTEADFRNKVKEGIESYFERESDRKLKKDLRNEILEATTIALPDEFLKRMVKANQEKPMDDHEFDHQYYHLAEDLRWNLILSNIAVDQQIVLTEDEIRDASRALMRQQFAQYGIYDMDDAKVEEMSARYLTEEGNYERFERTLREGKVFEYLKKTVKLDMTALPYDEFVARLNEKTAHELEHHH
jgi:trigger factor